MEEEATQETEDPAGEVSDQNTSEELTTESDEPTVEPDKDLDDSDSAKVEEPETPK